ncbi:hypothetical protein Ahy_B07g086935 [Arachis hypogaea]|uniref:Uncharacterized protein n=1 Tax=Arachis hypogaea TaxID=3818 RepID=A0A444YB87_ARAHY|nr:hypothetical protein Ahy_B07g086935 [Arachis hypogaea]
MPYVNLGSESDPLFQGQADESSINKPADSMLSLVEESASGLTQQKMMVVRMETHLQSEPLSTLSFTDSSQEETLNQEREPESQKRKSPEIPKLIEQLEELVEKIANSGVKTALDFAEGKSPPMEQ